MVRFYLMLIAVQLTVLPALAKDSPAQSRIKLREFLSRIVKSHSLALKMNEAKALETFAHDKLRIEAGVISEYVNQLDPGLQKEYRAVASSCQQNWIWALAKAGSLKAAARDRSGLLQKENSALRDYETQLRETRALLR